MIWNLNEYQDKVIELNTDKICDILIIGAGMTGLTLAYNMKDKKDIIVVDAGLIGHGVTLGSTAKITYLQETIYSKIKALRGNDCAVTYLKSQKTAIDYLKKIIEQENIKCDFKRVPSFVFANTKKEVKKLDKEAKFLKKNGIDITLRDLSSKITSYKSYAVDDTYIFNPLKYLNSIKTILQKNNTPIYENTKIENIEYINGEYICFSKTQTIKARKIVFATHYPYFKLPFFLPIKSYIEKSYIIVSRVENDGNYNCINTGQPTYSCRFYQDGKDIYQISLGESHNTAFKQNDAYHFKRVIEMFNLDDKNIITMCSNTDIISVDFIPYIGEIKKNMFIACGYNTWGMTNSVLASLILKDSLIGIRNEYRELCNPKRLTLANFIKLPTICFSQMKSFIGTKLSKNKKWYRSNVEFYNIDSKPYATYTDEEGKTHTILNRCPHLGCSLIFNEVEKTWDCPCHSSRFNIEGKCIKGPSNKNISIKKATPK